VYLPIKGTELAEEGERSEAVEQTETILIVEDEVIVSSALQAGFEDYGYTVLLSIDGAEGLETFRREQDRIDLVMMDLSMPTMTGEELLPQLLALNPALKVIVFSGYPVDPEDLPGIAKIVTKPVQTDDMVEILREVLDSP
jgi:CheY-like chemotaxis protein